MAKRRENNTITETVCGSDERGEFTKYKYADGSEYTVRSFVRDMTVQENSAGRTYMDRIAPQAVPFNEYLKKNNITRQEWWRRHEEAVQSRIHNCEIRTTILP